MKGSTPLDGYPTILGFYQTVRQFYPTVLGIYPTFIVLYPQNRAFVLPAQPKKSPKLIRLRDV